MSPTHFTAATRVVEVNGDRLAYRRWGHAATDPPPLFFLQHYRGGMDHWDPLMTDGLAAGREVILFNGRGVASSTGTPRTRTEDMADDAAAAIRAPGLHQVDVLGFSLGGFQALDLTWRHPELVRKLMLLGTGPRDSAQRVRAIKTGLKAVDRTGIMEVLGYTRQLRRIARGAAPRPGESGLAAFLQSALQSGWGTWRTRRLRASH